MLIRECFQRVVTRDIAPVVYFHDQKPENLAAEVSEYIITGGYPPEHPKAKRMPSGIHEEFVKLLRQLHKHRTSSEGVKLPASWISGFYGSGKSSFAKLLGLALDRRELPDGTPLWESLLAQDTSPLASELRKAWLAFTEPMLRDGRLATLSIVFDIGSVARSNEAIHEAVVRQLQVRLGYCATSNLVAEHEMKLEIDSEYPAFLVAAEKALGKLWDEVKRTRLAAQHFSAAMHAYDPKMYSHALAWHESAALLRDEAGRSVAEAVDAIDHMLQARATAETLFIVVDEVSQYVHQDRELMLKLQSFVSELGQSLKGQAWLLVTGQQKLEDASEYDVLSKLKDRFPAALRVHLSTANIRDVVHQRLLKKDPAKLGELQKLFHEHRSLLKNFAYECRDIEGRAATLARPALGPR